MVTFLFIQTHQSSNVKFFIKIVFFVGKKNAFARCIYGNRLRFFAWIVDIESVRHVILNAEFGDPVGLIWPCSETYLLRFLPFCDSFYGYFTYYFYFFRRKCCRFVSYF